VDGFDQFGKSAAVGELIDEFGDVLAADLAEYYNVRLTDLFTPGSGLTPGFLLALIKNLPMGSRFVAEKRGGVEFRGWGHDSYALAAVVNAIRSLQFTYVAAHSKSKPAPPKPFPVPDRPVAQGVKQGMFAQMASAHLQQQKG
jgi:hypothetical protein